MSPELIDEAARLLWDARKGRYQIDCLPESLRPANLEEAEAVQAALFTLIGRRRVGWFLGGTNGSAVITVPYAAPILDSAMFESPVELSQKVFMTWDVDVEFGFTFGSKLLPREKPYAEDEIVGAVASLHPTLDIVNSHYKNMDAVGWPSIIADNGCDGAVIRGRAVTRWDPRGLAHHPGVLRVNGKPLLQGTGAQIMGSPVNALAWFVNMMTSRGRAIEPGEFVTTGSCTDVYAGKLGDHVVADLGDFGTAEAAFAP